MPKLIHASKNLFVMICNSSVPVGSSVKSCLQLTSPGSASLFSPVRGPGWQGAMQLAVPGEPRLDTMRECTENNTHQQNLCILLQHNIDLQTSREKKISSF
ncbi:hypothetical protein Y1Q_0004062 [Alligator mississippiensis]|uniref:Uncharacterized protein n=1 Tax=Alligator mississippiensis TaxID=8496 RepID=A0A151PIH9_ALLMI|nr:hypothetical protein Y1Q_0004062 [Alligator mississippiensis]